MKQNKQQATTPGRGNKTSSNERGDQNGTATKVTGTAEDYLDNTDHSREEVQQSLLAGEQAQTKREIQTITSRLSTLVPGLKSHHQKSFDCISVPADTRNTTTAMKKMLRGRENNNSAHSGDPIDVESHDEKTSKNSYRTICCALLILMAFVLTAVIIVFFCSSPKVLDKEDRCLDGKKPFHNYNLFSTKTTYTSAHLYLNKTLQSSDLPKFIIKSDRSLKEVHETLKRKGCSVREFHFFGRHAARNPDRDDIEKNNKLLEIILKRIEESRKQTAAALHSPDGHHTPQPLTIDSSQISNANASEVVCHDPLSQLTSWSNWTHLEEGNLITEFGYQESEEIAKRFKSIYPELFNGSSTDIRVGTTDELRTAQTALSFLKLMDNPPDVGCPLNEFPSPLNRDISNAIKIQKDSCFKTFLEKKATPMLSFHKDCKRLATERHSFDLGVKSSPKFAAIATALTNKLQLANSLSADEVKVIYDACRYDTAQFGRSSIWCHLFEEDDLKFFEYVNDVIDFKTDAYGMTSQSDSACFVTMNVLDSFKAYASSKTPKTKANFYFTHSSVIQRLIAASINLAKDSAFSTETIKKYLAAGDVPSGRQWQTSILSPFSANIAFSLYDCNLPSADLSGNGKETTIDLGGLKVVASLNEQPFTLQGCQDLVCDYNTVSTKTSIFNVGNANSCTYERHCTFKFDVQ